MTDLPQGFVARMRTRLGEEADAFFEALLSPPDGLRVNTLRIPAERFAAISPFAMEPVVSVDEGFVLRGDHRVGAHPYHAAGLYYLQDPSAMVVGAAVDARPGERVLDLAAAPGGKATHLAARMGGRGVLVANDVSRSRAKELLGNLERFGVPNAIVTAETPERLASHFGPWFDRVLVDAPCSGESMFHKSAAARTDWSEASVAGCGRRQEEILDAAADLVRLGGSLYYSTCTFGEEENEAVIAKFLALHPDFEPAELEPVWGAGPVALPGSSQSAAGYRLWPHRMPGAGHFVFRMRRRSGAEPIALVAKPALPGASRDVALAFLGDGYSEPPPDPDRLSEHRGEMFLLPEEAPDLTGLHLLGTGLRLGRAEKHGFEPAHALAMVARRGDPSRRLALELDDPRVGQYLAGEQLRAPGPSGWTVITVGGYPLGWGKRTGDIVKNHYPKGLRRRR